MASLVRAIGRVSEVVGLAVAPLTGLITALVFVEVICRYIFNSPTSWTNEVENYLQIGLVMLGGAYTLRHGGHVRVDVVHRGLGPRSRALVDIVTALMIVIMAVPMCWFGWELAWEALVTGQTSVSGAELVLWPSMMAVPVGTVLLVLQALASVAQAASQLVSGQEGE